MPLSVRVSLALILTVLVSTVLAMGAAWLWALGRLIARKPFFPEEKTCPVPWKTVTLLLFVLEWVLITRSVGQLGSRALGIPRGPGPRELTAWQQMCLTTLVNVAILAIIPASLAAVSRSTSALRRLGIHREGLGRHVRRGAVVFLLLTPVVYRIQLSATQIWKPQKHPVEEMLVQNPTLAMALFTFVSTVILAPAAEELLFRGIVQNWLEGFFPGPAVPRSDPGAVHDGWGDSLDLVQETPGAAACAERGPPLGAPETEERPRSRGMKWMPVVLTAAFFAIVHFPQWPAPIAIFLLSLGLGSLYQSTGSLAASFTMHALFNAFSTLILFYVAFSGPPHDLKRPEPPIKKMAPVTGCAVPGVPAWAPSPGSEAAGLEKARLSNGFFHWRGGPGLLHFR
jgi:membrane protease YdiL (CAAX protease family)